MQILFKQGLNLETRLHIPTQIIPKYQSLPGTVVSHPYLIFNFPPVTISFVNLGDWSKSVESEAEDFKKSS